MTQDSWLGVATSCRFEEKQCRRRAVSLPVGSAPAAASRRFRAAVPPFEFEEVYLALGECRADTVLQRPMKDPRHRISIDPARSGAEPQARRMAIAALAWLRLLPRATSRE